MSTVFVVQEVEGKNLLPARQFGTLEALLPQGQIALLPGPSIFKLRQKLKNYSDTDYLLLVGDPVAIALAAMVAASFNNGKVNFLKWDRQERQYIEVKTDLNRRMLDE